MNFLSPETRTRSARFSLRLMRYGMGIDNLYVALVIQWDLPLSFDSMIQRMGRAGRKGCASTFVLLSPK